MAAQARGGYKETEFVPRPAESMRPMLSLLLTSALLVACGGTEAPETAVAETPSVTPAPAPARPQVPQRFAYEVVATFPHGESDFTQGFFVEDGVLYESTGRVGQSRLIRHGLLGEAEPARRDLPGRVFGEGATAIGDRIYSLTWRDGIAFVHDRATLAPLGEFDVDGEGWGLTDDGERLILSDGSNELKFIDPETFETIRTVPVTANGKPVRNLNELEWIDGEVWANVWQTEVIVRIDPENGHVTGFIDMSDLHGPVRDPRDDVLNGIAYDPDSGRLFVTGKNWSSIYEIEIVPAE